MHYMYVHIPTLCMIFDSKVDFMKLMCRLSPNLVKDIHWGSMFSLRFLGEGYYMYYYQF